MAEEHGLSSAVKDGNSGEKADRLSALDTPLLLHILSFLPTREAVKTCILSRRWETLWTSIPCLDFDDNWFPSPSSSPTTTRSGDEEYYCEDYYSEELNDEELEEQQQKKTQFSDFIEEVLIRRDGSDLRKFSLCLNFAYWGGYANDWVCYAVKHFVQRIQLYYYVIQAEGSMVHLLPRQLFACESLIHMYLHVEYGHLKLPKAPMSLPNLQSLKMAQFTVSGKCFQQLLYSCPKLEILELTDCYLLNAEILDFSCCLCLKSLILEGNELEDIKKINISVPKLENLTIVNSVDCHGSLNISSPNLLGLVYKDRLVEELCIENLQNMLDAVVDLRLCLNLFGNACQTGLKFLTAIEHVRTLTLYPSSMEIFTMMMDLGLHLSTSFMNLKFLELVIGEGKIDEIKAIACLLKFCPSVETLVVTVHCYLLGPQRGNNEGSWESECKLYNLKEAEIRWFKGHHFELILIKLLLKSAVVLERMIIIAPELDLQERQEISLKLQTYPRASSKMLIMFSDQMV